MLKIIALVAVALTFPVSADAMMCLSRSTVRDAYEESTVVFSGYVLDVAHRADAPTARLKVLQVWKGPLEADQIVQTSAEGSVTFIGDGFVPATGTTLLVYAVSDEPYFLNICSRTRDLDSAKREVRLLNRLAKKRRQSVGE